MNFTRETANDVLQNKIAGSQLIEKYPALKEAVWQEFSVFDQNSDSQEIMAVINGYKAKARFAAERIKKSGQNQQALNSFMPDIVKARIAIYLLEQLYIKARSGQSANKVRLNLWDGFILQKLLFKRGLERKPASLGRFKLAWKLIFNKKIVMPLLQQHGIYCFYSQELITELARLIGPVECLEIGAGDGTLTRFLQEAGVTCRATDDYSWGHYIKYPDFVENMEATAAVQTYRPAAVICSWPPPGNSFEKQVLAVPHVKLYIVIGSDNGLFAGNHEAYRRQSGFVMEHSQSLSQLVLPPGTGNAVYVFRRKE